MHDLKQKMNNKTEEKMMGVFIKNMKMPQCCGKCIFFSYRFYMCLITQEIFTSPLYDTTMEDILKKRRSICPLIEIKGEKQNDLR